MCVRLPATLKDRNIWAPVSWTQWMLRVYKSGGKLEHQ